MPAIFSPPAASNYRQDVSSSSLLPPPFLPAVPWRIAKGACRRLHSEGRMGRQGRAGCACAWRAGSCPRTILMLCRARQYTPHLLFPQFSRPYSYPALTWMPHVVPRTRAPVSQPLFPGLFPAHFSCAGRVKGVVVGSCSTCPALALPRSYPANPCAMTRPHLSLHPRDRVTPPCTRPHEGATRRSCGRWSWREPTWRPKMCGRVG